MNSCQKSASVELVAISDDSNHNLQVFAGNGVFISNEHMKYFEDAILALKQNFDSQ